MYCDLDLDLWPLTSTHLAWTEQQQHYNIPTSTRCAGIINQNQNGSIPNKAPVKHTCSVWQPRKAWVTTKKCEFHFQTDARQSDPYMYVCYAFQATQKLLFGYRYNFLNKRPKGPHNVHLSTMCYLFDRSARVTIFVYWLAKKTQTW